MATTTAPGGFRVLVSTRTAGFRHASIEAGVAAIRRLGHEHGFAVDDTADPARIGQGLAGYRAVVFLSTTGDLLDPGQQAALERYLQDGGGWVGVHGAADAEYDWPWYGGLVGAWFRRHPAVQRATVRPAPGAAALAGKPPARWERGDEWYDFRANPRGRVRVLATVDESTYRGGGMGTGHPIAWCRSTAAAGPGTAPWAIPAEASGSRRSWPTCWPASAMPPGGPRPAAPPVPNRRRAGGGSGG
ncbi:MAG TPA: ThuA domain-containing protein [Actinomycetota bacterium]|nr:ThuA domain-containing protein [Actinomycetota bacterium]